VVPGVDEEVRILDRKNNEGRKYRKINGKKIVKRNEK
jgi:hypothetical protein